MKNFNHTYKALLVALTALGATTALAAPATIPNTFSAGTPAVAADVNENFTELKAAIDDNDSKINIPSGGFVSVPPAAFQNEDHFTTCSWSLAGGASVIKYGFYDASLTSLNICDAVAGIQLPHNASIASLKCYAADATLGGGALAAVRLYRSRLAETDDAELIFLTPATAISSAVQELTDMIPTTPGQELVNNEDYSYTIMLDFDNNTNSISSDLRFYGCTVGY